MTSVATGRWASRWTPPHDASELQHILTALSKHQRTDWDKVLSALDVVLQGQEETSHHAAGRSGSGPSPAYEDAAELAEHFRIALTELTNRGLSDHADAHADVADLIAEARELTSKEPTDTLPPPLFALRRMAVLTLALIERLDELRIVRGVIER
ncbi:hypothetical protein ACFQ8Q_23400 [Streptomyces cyaneofuscatus]|uniref:hypothetical protein n=1 Tax=Streptomyces cyaneofuscatus TaxID=66883 RepID=UPI0036C91ADF